MGVYWKAQPRYKPNPPEIISVGDGVNTYTNPFSIKKSECVKSLNTSSRSFPSISVRPGSSVEFNTDVTPLVIPYAVGSRIASVFHVVDGTTWKYWNEGTQAFIDVATSLTASFGKLLEFGTATDKYTILMNSTDKKAWNGTGAATDLTNAPLTNLICTDDNRLYALLDNTINATAIGDITDWTTVDAAFEIVLSGMVGYGTSIQAFNDMVIAWSDQTMHIIYGNDYADSQPTDPIPYGCVSDRSVVVNDGVLYFMDYNRYYAFTSGMPTDISQKVRKYLENINYTYKEKIVASKWGRYVYLSIPHTVAATQNNLTLEYDTELKTWYPWDIGFTNFFTLGENLYGTTTSGTVLKLQQGTADGSTAITWSIESGVWDSTPVRPKKILSNIYAIVDLPVSSTMNVSYSTTVDGNDWVSIYDFVANANEQNTRVMIPTTMLQNVDFYRLKFSGTGPSTIHYVELDKRIKAR